MGDTTSSDSDTDDPTRGGAINADADTEESDATASAAGDGDRDGVGPGTTRTNDRSRRGGVLVGAGIAAALVLIGAVAAMSSVGDDGPAAAGDGASHAAVSTTSISDTTTTSTSTTTTTLATTSTTVVPTSAPREPAAGPSGDDGVMTEITEPPAAVPVCGYGPWGQSRPQGGIEVPDHATLVEGPTWNCADGSSGCTISVSTTWSDGVTAADSQVLPAPGWYTLNDGRGTTASFRVSPEFVCSFSSADYTTIWPPAA